MKVKRQSIYVAGSYRSKWGVIGKIINIIKAYRVGRRLVKQGYCVYIPHMNTALMDIACQGDQFFLDCGIKMLKKFEIIYMMKGWEKSEGARAEYREALRRGMEVWLSGNAIIAPAPYSKEEFKNIELPTSPANCKLKTDSWETQEAKDV